MRSWVARGALASSLWLLAACKGTEHTPVPPAPGVQASAPSIVPAPPEESMPEVSAVCARFASTAAPAQDLPSPSELAELARNESNCDTDDAYFGIDGPIDLARARKCSFGRPRAAAPGQVDRPDVLMMIYANGSGVPANFDLALHFACETGGSGLELLGRVTRLWEARQRGKLEGVLDVCDDATSGALLGACASRLERVAEVQRKLRRAAATAGMPVPEVKALLRASNSYIHARSRKEVDTSGTLRDSFVMGEQDQLEASFVDAIEQLHDPGFVPEAADPKAIDKQLSAWTKRISTCKYMAQSELGMPGFITRAGIRETQRAWLAYREAFVALAMKAKPKSSADAWRAWLTEARLKQLQELGASC